MLTEIVLIDQTHVWIDPSMIWLVTQISDTQISLSYANGREFIVPIDEWRDISFYIHHTKHKENKC